MHKRRNFLFAIVAVWAVIYLASIFTPPLLDDADTVHAEAAREMLARNDWVTLHIDLGIGTATDRLPPWTPHLR